MSKTVRRDKIPWWNGGVLPKVKNFDGLKCRRDWTCKPTCPCRGDSKRLRMKRIRQSEALDIDERV